jgi:inosine-uridine nucleoside N-ribohydrolase
VVLWCGRRDCFWTLTQSGRGLMSGPVLVDSDPGIDDALPLHYLVAAGGWDLKAITAVAGNVPSPRAVANASGLAARLAGNLYVETQGGARGVRRPSSVRL